MPTLPRPATLEDCKEASTREARKRYHVDNVQFHEVRVNGKHRKVDATEKVASNSKLDLNYSPSPQVQAGFRTSSHKFVHKMPSVVSKQLCKSRLVLQPRTDPVKKAVKKAVQRLAKKELVSFGAAVRSRICSGKPNKPRDAPGFSQTVDKHIQKFQPYFQLTGVIRRFVVACLCLTSYACHWGNP